MKRIMTATVVALASSQLPVHAKDYVVGSGPAELAEALRFASEDAGFDRIILEPDATYIVGRERIERLPTLQGRIQILGNGATIRRYSDVEDVVFRIERGAEVHLINLRISDGSSGAINNLGDLAMTDCVLEDNAGAVRASALENHGSAVLTRTRVQFNSYSGSGPGGAIFNSGSLRLIDSIIAENTAHGSLQGLGAALVNLGSAWVNRSEVFNNSGPYHDASAAIYSASPAVLTLTDSTIRANEPRWLAVEGDIAAVESVNNAFE